MKRVTLRGRLQIVLADDHSLVRAGIVKLLERDFTLVGVVSDGLELVEAVKTLQPDVAVVDIGLPRMNGIEAAREIRAAGLPTKVVFLSMHSEPDYVIEALRAGGSGYVLKHSSPDELNTAIREAVQGRIYITPLIPGNVTDLMRRGEKQTELLTSRQRQVVQLVAEGFSSKEIGVMLGVSAKTVEFHRANLMEKLGVRTTADLTRYAMQLGLVIGGGSLPQGPRAEGRGQD